MSLNQEAWTAALNAWEKLHGVIGFETRKDAFLQGFYIAYNAINKAEEKPVTTITKNLDKLYPKYNCPVCHDWFHMPYKFCQCDNSNKVPMRYENIATGEVGTVVAQSGNGVHLISDGHPIYVSSAELERSWVKVLECEHPGEYNAATNEVSDD